MLSIIYSAFARKLEMLKAIFTIPPFDESMAGVIIVYVFTNSVATSIWMFNAWTPFIYTLFNGSNFYVGLMSAVNGVFEFSCAIVSGHIADKIWGPSITLRRAIYFGLVNLTVVIIAVWSERLPLLILAQCCEGTYMGFSFTCLESVFAQCLRRGERDRLYSVKFSLESVGPIAGLILSAVLYSVVGNAWNVRVLRWVITCGVLLHVGSMLTFLAHFRPLPWCPHRKRVAANRAEDVTVLNGVVAADCADGQESAAVDASSGAVAAVGKAEEDKTQKQHEVQMPRQAKMATSSYEEEEHRIEAGDEEEVLPEPVVRPGPATEVFNRARTALCSAQRGPPPMIALYDPSVCTVGETAAERCRTTDADGAHSTLSCHHSTAMPCSNELFADDEGGDMASAPVAPHKSPLYYVDLEEQRASGWRRRLMRHIPLDWYPFVIIICDVILIVGSGMTTQYFGLFMMNIYHVSPIGLSMLGLCSSLLIAVLAIVVGYAGQRWGRVRAMLPPKIIGSFLLLWMALARGTVYAPKALMCVVYVVRNAFMNCTSGLSRALMMDLVPEERHGRWNAIESVQSAGWSGTAFLGGFIADRYGYGAAFIFTFGFHITSCLLALPLTVRNDARLPQPVYEKETDEPTAMPPPPRVATLVGELTEANVRKVPSSPQLLTCRPLPLEEDEEGGGERTTAGNRTAPQPPLQVESDDRMR